MEHESSLAFIARRSVGRLATSDINGKPHSIPVCYSVFEGKIVIAIDQKPKQLQDPWKLKRVRNILENPQVALIVDDYLDNQWDQLGYVLIQGTASIIDAQATIHTPVLQELRAKYKQYATLLRDDTILIIITIEKAIPWGAIEARIQRPAMLEQVISGRRSVRRFSLKSVEKAQILTVLEAAQWAPSPHGRQPWRFVVITEQENKDRLAMAMGSDWETILSQDGQSSEIIQQRLAISHERIRSAPVLILACLFSAELDTYPDHDRQNAEMTMAIQSLGAAIQNMLLTAYHIGLDMGWMCAPLFCQPIVQAALALPSTWLPHALLPLGYAASDPKRRQRKPLAEMMEWR